MEFTDLDTGLFTKMSREEIVFPSMQRMLLIPEIARLDVVRSELTNMAVCFLSKMIRVEGFIH